MLFVFVAGCDKHSAVLVIYGAFVLLALDASSTVGKRAALRPPAGAPPAAAPHLFAEAPGVGPLALACPAGLVLTRVDAALGAPPGGRCAAPSFAAMLLARMASGVAEAGSTLRSTNMPAPLAAAPASAPRRVRLVLVSLMVSSPRAGW